MEADAVNNMHIEASQNETITIKGTVAVDRNKISSTDLEAAGRQNIVDSLGIIKTAVDCTLTVADISMPYVAAVTYCLTDATLSDSIEKWVVNDKSNSADLVALDYGMGIKLNDSSSNKNVLNNADQRLQLDYWTYGDIGLSWSFVVRSTKKGSIHEYTYDYKCASRPVSKDLSIDVFGNLK